MGLSRSAIVVCALMAAAGCSPQAFNPGGASGVNSRVGTWQLIPIADGGVWKINTETGETRRCIDGMLEKACVLATNVDSVAELKAPPPAPPPAPPSPSVAPDATAPIPAAPEGPTPPASEP